MKKLLCIIFIFLFSQTLLACIVHENHLKFSRPITAEELQKIPYSKKLNLTEKNTRIRTAESILNGMSKEDGMHAALTETRIDHYKNLIADSSALLDEFSSFLEDCIFLLKSITDSYPNRSTIPISNRSLIPTQIDH